MPQSNCWHHREVSAATARALQRISDTEMIARIWRHDHTVWRDDPTEISNRLDWLESPTEMRAVLPELQAFADEVRTAGYTHALLLGMGGSSLAPEVLRRTFGVARRGLDLDILDSTDPAAVLAKWSRSAPQRTLYVVSTKSGTTVETLCFLNYFYTRGQAALGAEEVGAHFAAITDRGSRLEQLARALRFRRIFCSNPNIGGRYSALSHFGLVPGALIGLDLAALLERAAAMAALCRKSATPAAAASAALSSAGNPGAELGALLAAGAQIGRDKLTLISTPALEPFGPWIEQLVAESTGKDGRGILPVVGWRRPADQDTLPPPASGMNEASDRLFVELRWASDPARAAEAAALEAAGHPVVSIELQDAYDLGAEFFRWEMATAVAGALLGIQPFDQPNVESAKVQARELTAVYQRSGRLPDESPTAAADGMRIFAPFAARDARDALQRLREFASGGTTGGASRSYVALQAYLPPSAPCDTALQRLRAHLESRWGLATTVGYGPRFLHSTGQLHKGDGGHGLFIQVTAAPKADIAIPDEPGQAESSLSFGVLELAQALGDRRALADAGRPVVRFHLEGDPLVGLQRIAAALG